jgi:hypothetical protein
MNLCGSDRRAAASRRWGFRVVSQDTQIAHVCLVGGKVSDDWPLIRELKARHLVTLAGRSELLNGHPLLGTAQVLVLDGDATGGFLPALRTSYPGLQVLLVSGGLDQGQVVLAFRQGVRDYFPDPYDVRLLAERVDHFCDSPPGAPTREA